MRKRLAYYFRLRFVCNLVHSWGAFSGFVDDVVFIRSFSVILFGLLRMVGVFFFLFLLFFSLLLFIIGFDDTRDNKKEKVIKIFIVVFIRWMGADECARCGVANRGEQCQSRGRTMNAKPW